MDKTLAELKPPGFPRPDSQLVTLWRKAAVCGILNIYRGGYEAHLKMLPRISGPAIVAGSAPNPTRPAGLDSTWFRVSINASQIIFDRFELGPPNLTIFQPKIRFTDKSRQAKWDVLRGRSTDHLVINVNQKNNGRISDLLAANSYSANAVTLLEANHKNALVAELTGETIVSPYPGSFSLSR
jgi:hypothetical protein